MPSLFVARAQIQSTMYARQVFYQLSYISGPPVTVIHSLEVTLFLAPSGEHPLQWHGIFLSNSALSDFTLLAKNKL